MRTDFCLRHSTSAPANREGIVSSEQLANKTVYSDSSPSQFVRTMQMVDKSKSAEDTDAAFANGGTLSKPGYARILRIIFTLGSLSILAYHLHTLVERYRKQPVTVQTSTGDFQMPEIHVCPQAPFSGSIIRLLKLERNNSEWLLIENILRRMEETIEYYPDTDEDVRWVVISISFWETLPLPLIHRLISLPTFEAMIRLNINDLGEAS